jgi:hypothetical protein
MQVLLLALTFLPVIDAAVLVTHGYGKCDENLQL